MTSFFFFLEQSFHVGPHWVTRNTGFIVGSVGSMVTGLWLTIYSLNSYYSKVRKTCTGSSEVLAQKLDGKYQAIIFFILNQNLPSIFQVTYNHQTFAHRRAIASTSWNAVFGENKIIKRVKNTKNLCHCALRCVCTRAWRQLCVSANGSVRVNTSCVQSTLLKHPPKPGQGGAQVVTGVRCTVEHSLAAEFPHLPCCPNASLNIMPSTESLPSFCAIRNQNERRSFAPYHPETRWSCVCSPSQGLHWQFLFHFILLLLSYSALQKQVILLSVRKQDQSLQGCPSEFSLF